MIALLQITGISVVAMTFSYFGVAVLRRVAERRKIMDIPNERSSHSLPTPRGGGIAIAIISLTGLMVGGYFFPLGSWSTTITYLCGAFFIAGISCLDDLYSLPNTVRFTGHSLAALFSVIWFGYWSHVSVPFFGELHLGWFGAFLTFLWIVGLTNAYNFMDGIDGIAGGQAVIAGLGWAFWGFMNDHMFAGILGLLLAASCLGFLGHNWPPARIFMGDVGSAFLGYTFSILAVIAAQNDPRLAVAGILFVWPFVFDSSFTFFLRLLKGENVFMAHRSHLYQRLVMAGCTHRFVSSLYIGLALLGVVLSLGWLEQLKGCSVLIGLGIPSLCLGLWGFVNRKESLRGIRRPEWSRFNSGGMS